MSPRVPTFIVPDSLLRLPIVITDDVIVSPKDDILFNRIQETKTLDAWCDDNQIPSEVDDGTICDGLLHARSA